MGLWKRFFRKSENVPAHDTSALCHEQAAPEQPFVQQTPYAAEIDGFMDREFPGRAVTVWHELVSDGFHLDVCVMSPTPKEPYYVLYTNGMSALPMTLENVPHVGRYQHLRRAELMMYLPAEWPVEELRRENAEEIPESAYWPIRALKYLARMPHRYHTWLGAGHSVPNGEPMRPFEGSRGFAGIVLYFPDEGNGPKKVLPVPTGDGGQVMLYLAVPVYAGEMEYKLQKGADALEERLRSLPGGIGFIVTEGRPDTSKSQEGC